MLEITGSLGFGSTVVLPDVRLSATPGEVILLVGPNGSGKTTLLRTVAGLLRPTAGTVTVAGLPTASRRARRLIGFAPDPPPLYEELTAWEHIELAQRLWTPDAVDLEVDTLVETFSLGSHLHQRADRLSIGLRKRLGIVLAVMHRPRVIAMDEPFNGLDSDSTERLQEFLLARRESGDVVLCSTHQPTLVRDLATRVVHITDGGLLDTAPALSRRAEAST